MEIVRELNLDTWREFIETHPQSRVFHTPEMAQVFSATKGYYPQLWVALDADRTPLALFMPVEIALAGGLLRRFTSRAVDYAGALCVPGPAGETALRALLRTYRQTVGIRYLFTELRNLSDMSALQPILNDSGFVYEDHLNFGVDLTCSPADLWSRIRSNAQRNIRKAGKLQVTVEDVSDPGRIPAVYALLEQVYRRIQVPLADSSFFQAAFTTLHPQGMLKVFVAQAEGKDIGALSVLCYKDVLIYWYAGVLKEYSEYRAGDLLVWHVLEWGQRQGFRLLDFGGAGRAAEKYGVRDFKAKFGGTLVNYGRNICVHTPISMAPLKAVYHAGRTLLYGQRANGGGH